MAGLLIAFEGLDQSGKQTQAEALRDHLSAGGVRARVVSFPAYETAIGQELQRALHGERDYGPDVMQLLYVANRYERQGDLRAGLDAGDVLICDRYVASSVAYGEAQGLEASWLQDIQRFLPPADLTILLDIAPETAVGRKATGRDRYERDLALQARVRESYLRQARAGAWLRLDGERERTVIAREIVTAVDTRLGRR
ncbi:MAG TPA: dTMP kinase [Vicinamibacterales bacterium]|nr:dTMP kinase [Vicinamibacterales bacterium]